MPDFNENLNNERVMAKKIALNDVKSWIDRMPVEERNKPTILVGDKAFTPNQLMEEVEKETVYGKSMQKKLERLRMEVSKKED